MSIIVYSKPNCVQCEQAKYLLTENHLDFEVREIGDQWTREHLLEMIPTARSVPQIIINDVIVGGLDSLKTYLKEHNDRT